MIDLVDRLRRGALAEERLRRTARERPDPDEDENREPEQDRDEQQESANDEPEHSKLQSLPSACQTVCGAGLAGPTNASDWTSRSTRSRRTECRPGSGRTR